MCTVGPITVVPRDRVGGRNENSSVGEIPSRYCVHTWYDVPGNRHIGRRLHPLRCQEEISLETLPKGRAVSSPVGYTAGFSSLTCAPVAAAASAAVRSDNESSSSSSRIGACATRGCHRIDDELLKRCVFKFRDSSFFLRDIQRFLKGPSVLRRSAARTRVHGKRARAPRLASPRPASLACLDF